MSQLPNFFIIGVAKGGTTSLYQYLAQHPEVYLSSIKETNHFAMADIDSERLDPIYARDIKLDLDSYISTGMKKSIHIAHVEQKKHYKALFASAPLSAKAIGEVSNSYIISPSAIPALRTAVPSAKLVVLLRNPVKRAWSHFLMNIREGKNTYDDFILEIEKDYTAKHKGWGVNHQYLELGRYYDQMKRVYDHFNPDQVRWYLFEDLVSNPGKILEQITEFLGVDTAFAFNVDQRANVAQMPRNVILNKVMVQSGLIHRIKALAGSRAREWGKKLLYQKNEKVPAMTVNEASYLESFYRDDVHSLSMLLNFNFNQAWNL